MQLSGRITSQEVNEINKLVRSKWYWPKFLISNLYGIVLFGAILWATIAAFLSGKQDRRLFFVWIVLFAIIGVAAIDTRISRKKGLRKFNESQPQTIRIDSTGVLTEGQGGSKSIHPWHAFRSWRSAGTVILLDLVGSDGFLILPLNALSTAERELLRGIIKQQVGHSATMES
jgi:hypothetical protein